MDFIEGKLTRDHTIFDTTNHDNTRINVLTTTMARRHGPVPLRKMQVESGWTAAQATASYLQPLADQGSWKHDLHALEDRPSDAPSLVHADTGSLEEETVATLRGCWDANASIQTIPCSRLPSLQQEVCRISLYCLVSVRCSPGGQSRMEEIGSSSSYRRCQAKFNISFLRPSVLLSGSDQSKALWSTLLINTSSGSSYHRHKATCLLSSSISRRYSRR